MLDFGTLVQIYLQGGFISIICLVFLRTSDKQGESSAQSEVSLTSYALANGLLVENVHIEAQGEELNI